MRLENVPQGSISSITSVCDQRKENSFLLELHPKNNQWIFFFKSQSRELWMPTTSGLHAQGSNTILYIWWLSTNLYFSYHRFNKPCYHPISKTFHKMELKLQHQTSKKVSRQWIHHSGNRLCYQMDQSEALWTTITHITTTFVQQLACMDLATIGLPLKQCHQHDNSYVGL